MTYTGNRRSIGFRKPQRGDVVVIKTKGYYYNEGDLGIIVDTNDQVVPDHCQVQNENEGNSWNSWVDSWVVLKHNEFEVIDHDEDLLKDPDRQETKTIVKTPDGKSELGYLWVVGHGVGTVIAIIVSWSVNHSIFWCIIHGFFGWLYMIYYILRQSSV